MPLGQTNQVFMEGDQFDDDDEVVLSLNDVDDPNDKPSEKEPKDGSGTSRTDASNMSSGDRRTNLPSMRNPSASALKMHLGSAETDSTMGTSPQIESKSVTPTWARLFVIVFLLFSAFIITYVTFRLASDQEADSYRSKFDGASGQIIDTLTLKLTDTKEFLESWSLHISSSVPEANSWRSSVSKANSWPFIVVPNFEIQGRDALEKVGGKRISLCPVVNSDEKVEWDKYSESRSEIALNSTGVVWTPYIHRPLLSETNAEEPLVGDSYLPIHQTTPAVESDFLINFDTLDDPVIRKSYKSVMDTLSSTIAAYETPDETPEALVSIPIMENRQGVEKDQTLVGILEASVIWETYFDDLLPEDVPPIVVVVSNACAGSFTFLVEGSESIFLGFGDQPGSRNDKFQLTKSSHLDVFGKLEDCGFNVDVYPTDDFYNAYKSNRPFVYAGIAVLLFAGTAMAFMFYDYIVKKSHKKIKKVAQESSALVSSLFPANVRSRLMGSKKPVPEDSPLVRGAGSFIPKTGKPIADLFPNATVLFADIAGFTAWSSSREPSQVFTLLESLYSSFDDIAKKKHVFKVETIGDCYVAATGLPEPSPDHAGIMARFAVACMHRFREVVCDLEVTLGPDTADLSLRVGIHSGPVTAGILRGEKSRFQLFGDTVNVASRMESTGASNNIHLSKTTADLVVSECHELSVRPRDQMMEVKGKGKMQTYWLVFQSNDELSAYSDHESTAGLSSTGSVSSGINPVTMTDIPAHEKQERLIDWNVDVLQGLLKKVVAMRDPKALKKPLKKIAKLVVEREEGLMVIDEVQEIMNIRNVTADYKVDPSKIELGSVVTAQLRDFVTVIASKYRMNHFHSFEHASHVTQSVIKLLGRIVAPQIDYDSLTFKKKENAVLHVYTYGITSDPLTQFAAAFSALIHDLDHPGVPNATLIKEKTRLARQYKDKSVAEQNSVDLAWDILMRDEYLDLRACIYNSRKELYRFRQLVVNAVMSTDIVDKELKALRNKRWDTAFNLNGQTGSEAQRVDPIKTSAEDMSRKATIVIEHLIQASDVSHTMQHWHVYQKWNQRYFFECYQGYLEGRSDTDPSDGWYKGELGFFDFYIIPLAKKLKECGVFGVSSDEFLNYALSNRAEWEEKGAELVEQYIAAYKAHVFGAFQASQKPPVPLS